MSQNELSTVQRRGKEWVGYSRQKNKTGKQYNRQKYLCSNLEDEFATRSVCKELLLRLERVTSHR